MMAPKRRKQLACQGEYEATIAPKSRFNGLIFPFINRSYLDEFQLFYFLFQEIPNKISEVNIDVEQARQHFLKKYEGQIVDTYLNKACYGKLRTAKEDDCIYTIAPDFMVYFDTQQSIMRYLFKDTPLELVEQLVEEINQFKHKEEVEAESEIYLLVNTPQGFSLEKFKLPKTEVELQEHYNDDFAEVHEIIVKRLTRRKDKGIVLLHGAPGTGKTSYIRYLTSVVGKKIIFFPPTLTESITHPSFISLLIENPDSVLVIEDAENILLDRNYTNKSGVSALLNLSDGLLADCLNIQIICTFNTDVAKVDSALLRKGRLIASYKFEALDIEKAQLLSDKIGFNSYISEPTRLTDVYNQDDRSMQIKPKKCVGFNAYQDA